MENILNSLQMRQADAFTIVNEPISSIDLMERASNAFVKLFVAHYPDRASPITVVCGQGNNGGDGLVIARLLWALQYRFVTVIYLRFSDQQSEDNRINLERLQQTGVPLEVITTATAFQLDQAKVVIDAILGSGLNKALKDELGKVVEKINQSSAAVVAVDVPTGFATDSELQSDYNGVYANLVISFQLPKLNFFFPESAAAIGNFEIIDIGLSQKFIAEQQSDFQLVTAKDIQKIIRPRKRFSHKGTYGHALIAAGATHTMGAALLCSHACLKTGAGLTTLRCPKDGLTALNVALPEVMAMPNTIDQQESNLLRFDAFALGPGWGVCDEHLDFLSVVADQGKPMVLDADALTMLASNPQLLQQLSEHTIITPHLKEFDRLFGSHQNWWKRVATARAKAKQLNIVIVLKNQYTFIALPSGKICINPTGNPAMAQGGMGDTLTGIIVALLAQHYTAEQAAILGVYLHGAAGDALAAQQAVVSASQISDEIPRILKKMSGNSIQ